MSLFGQVFFAPSLRKSMLIRISRSSGFKMAVSIPFPWVLSCMAVASGGARGGSCPPQSKNHH